MFYNLFCVKCLDSWGQWAFDAKSADKFTEPVDLDEAPV